MGNEHGWSKGKLMEQTMMTVLVSNKEPKTNPTGRVARETLTTVLVVRKECLFITKVLVVRETQTMTTVPVSWDSVASADNSGFLGKTCNQSNSSRKRGRSLCAGTCFSGAGGRGARTRLFVGSGRRVRHGRSRGCGFGQRTGFRRRAYCCARNVAPRGSSGTRAMEVVRQLCGAKPLQRWCAWMTRSSLSCATPKSRTVRSTARWAATGNVRGERDCDQVPGCTDLAGVPKMVVKNLTSRLAWNLS